MRKIYIIAGEASGDNIGAKLMKAIRSQNPNVEFYGIGGDKMQGQKMKLLFPAKELSVMGFLEVLPHIFKFLKLIKQTIEDIIRIQPDVVITIDSPGFCFRVAKNVKERIKGKLVHYVAPTVWVYKPERAKKIAKLYDHLLVILPFEPEYFLKEGLATSYVGHPAIEDLKMQDKQIFRNKYKIPQGNLLVCLAPGSRKQEIKRLLPIFLESIQYLSKKVKQNITIVIPIKDYLKKMIEEGIDESLDIILVDEKDKEGLFSSCDVALAKSGTITTELAFYQMPMVVGYKINPISYWLLKRMVVGKYATILNVLADKELVPELLQDKCNPLEIGEALYQATLLQNRTKWNKEVKLQLAKLQVGKKIPSQLAAKVILNI
ncbi:MAG: lipid-A-disaccharide synthase [Rickettsiales bacterium]|jgi:lipid-A-disaccharide synthase|nr:lipid-A-disaccharide synthase [Rickettsiales bacterium]